MEYLIIFLIAFIYGFFFGKFQVFPYQPLLKIFKKLRERKKPKPILLEGYSNTSDREEVDSSIIKRDNAMVILALGQAHAANSAEVEYIPKEKGVYNLYNAKCYVAKDPLLGASATNEHKGSVWTRLADLLINDNQYGQVFIKSIAIAGTPIICWTTEGEGYGWGKQYHGNYHHRILQAYQELKALNLMPTHICWVQGESDTVNKTTKEEYKKHFLNIRSSIRKLGMEAPIYMALTSRDDDTFQVGEEVLQAQKELILEHNDILEGPNLNEIDSVDDRLIPSVNFTEQGVKKYANAWFNIVKKEKR